MVGSFRCLTSLLLLSISLKAEVFKYTTPFKQTYREKQAEGDTFADPKKTDSFQGANQKIGGPVFSWQHPPANQSRLSGSLMKYLGYVNSPLTQVRHIRRTQDQIIFDVVYSFDEHSRRIVPLNKKPSQKLFLTLLGCSFVQGNALNDDQTLGYFLAKHSPDYYPYNYGIGGTGTSTVLALTERINFKEQIPEQKGVFVYVYIEAHPRRSLGAWPEIQWSENLPYYKKNEEGLLVHSGSVAEARPYYVKALQTVGKFFGNNVLKDRVFPYLSENDELLTCQMVSQARDNLKKVYPESQFIMYGHPSGGAISDTLYKCLIEKSIYVHRGFVQEFGNDVNQYVVVGDNHPNAAANDLISQDILKAINNLQRSN